MQRAHPNRGALLTILTDGLATPHRRFAANLTPTPECPDCGCQDADQVHILWQCPAWQHLREQLPVKWHPDWPPCVTTALHYHHHLAPISKDTWAQQQLQMAILVNSWQTKRRDERHSHEVRPVGPPERPPQQDRDQHEEVSVLPPQASHRQLRAMRWTPLDTSAARKQWGWETQTYHQLWHYWSRCPPPLTEAMGAAIPTTWLEHWLDFFILNRLQPVCDTWLTENTIRRQLWRFARASRQISTLCAFQQPLAAEDSGEETHRPMPGLPNLVIAQQQGALCQPAQVHHGLRALLSLVTGRHDPLSISWQQLREALPQPEDSTPLSTMAPTRHIFRRMTCKQAPHPAWMDLMQATRPATDTTLPQNVEELDFEQLRRIPLRQALDRCTDTTKRRLLALRAAWGHYISMMEWTNGHRALAVWGAKKLRCAQCHKLLDMNRLLQIAKQPCIPRQEVTPSLCEQWTRQAQDMIDWLSTPIGVRGQEWEPLDRDILSLSECTDLRLRTWLNCSHKAPMGTVRSRLSDLLFKWQLVHQAWMMADSHKPSFRSIQGDPQDCITCGLRPPPAAKLKRFLSRPCPGDFAPAPGQVTAYLQVCLRIEQGLKRAKDQAI